MNRRSFLQTTLAAIPALAVLRSLSWAQDAKKPDAANAKPAEAEGTLAKESDPMAKSLNYCENADKGKNKVCPTRKEPARAKQYCDGCQFYTAAGTKGKDSVGKCQILQNNLVKSKGWCNSWVQKA
jgi:hypothetical protein